MSVEPGGPSVERHAEPNAGRRLTSEQPPEATIDFETLVKGEDLLQLLEAGEAARVDSRLDLADVLEARGYDALETDAVYRELDD